jgi:hypothetical protein
MSRHYTAPILAGNRKGRSCPASFLPTPFFTDFSLLKNTIMAAKKMELETINEIHYETFKKKVERFVGLIANPETMKIQFEVKERSTNPTMQVFSYWAFILYDGELTK